MISKWGVQNFKSIREETELDLGPLTIFAGANSSGKSTFIQSVLLVAQTLAHKVGSRSVVLNGTFTSLGQFDDLKSNEGDSEQIVVKCTCQPLSGQSVTTASRSQFTPLGAIYLRRRFNQLKEIDCEISFDADPASVERDLFQIQPRLFTTHLSSVYRDEDEDNVGQRVDMSIRHSPKPIYKIAESDGGDKMDDQLRASMAYAVEMDDDAMAEVKEDFRSAQPIGCMLRHFLPERIVYAIDPVEEDASALALALQDNSFRSRRPVRRRGRGKEILISQEILALLLEIVDGTVDFDPTDKRETMRELSVDSDSRTLSFSAWYEWIRNLKVSERRRIQGRLQECEDLFERIHSVMKSSMSGEKESRDLIAARPPRGITDATFYLDEFFSSSLKYLGPLRDSPKPLYPLTPAADPHDVGLRGEHTASILELHKNKEINFIPSRQFNDPDIDRTTITRTLGVAVKDWLQYLGVADSVESRDQGKLGHELKVGFADSDIMQDLTHVGVGVSQVLPILVMCLLADEDSTLVFEQPELHLHPRVQTLLGDFFLSMALCNKQCIVETHSEYLIDRLRFRIASATDENELTNYAKIYFVEKPARSSTFREVVINEYGAILEWPDGFFDQSQQQAEEIVKAATVKRKKNRKNEDG